MDACASLYMGEEGSSVCVCSTHVYSMCGYSSSEALPYSSVKRVFVDSCTCKEVFDTAGKKRLSLEIQ